MSNFDKHVLAFFPTHIHFGPIQRLQSIRKIIYFWCTFGWKCWVIYCWGLLNACSYDVDDVIGRVDRFGFQNFCSSDGNDHKICKVHRMLMMLHRLITQMFRHQLLQFERHTWFIWKVQICSHYLLDDLIFWGFYPHQKQKWHSSSGTDKLGTLQSLYYATHYNTVLVITRPGLGSQIVIFL